jgi:uncharacterized protein involved in oxidation of intracellular sulfur
MTEKQEKIMYFCTHASGNTEKAAMPFVMANAALAMDVKAIVVLQGEGVYLAKIGYAQNMCPPGGFPPIAKLMEDFLELGGDLRVCGPCIKKRNIDEASDLIEGAQTTAAGVLTVEALESDAVFVY